MKTKTQSEKAVSPDRDGWRVLRVRPGHLEPILLMLFDAGLAVEVSGAGYAEGNDDIVVSWC